MPEIGHERLISDKRLFHALGREDVTMIEGVPYIRMDVVKEKIAMSPSIFHPHNFCPFCGAQYALCVGGGGGHAGKKVDE